MTLASVATSELAGEKIKMVIVIIMMRKMVLKY